MIRHRLPAVDFAWTVPAHMDCHDSLQPSADAAALWFVARLDAATSLEMREALARDLHEKGYYWLSTLTNLDTIESRPDGTDSEQAIIRSEFGLSSAAGIRGGQNLPGLIMRPFAGVHRPKTELSRSNLYSARGKRRAAEDSFVAAKELIGSLTAGEQSELAPALLRRWAQISRSILDATEAVNAAESPYSLDAAHVMRAILAVDHGDVETLERSLERLDGRSADMSWLYRAEAEFIHALRLIMLGSKDTEQIYARLCVAQFIYVALGLQMSISPDLKRLLNSEARSWDWTPADVAKAYLGQRRLLGPADCLEIRKRTLLDTNFLERLLTPMMGWIGPSAPGPGWIRARIPELRSH